jgi:hypothetical protein
MSFAALLQNNKVELEWSTASETNNLGFQVERSMGNEAFEVLGFVPGYGTTSLAQSYHFTDAAPAIGENHYRLRQMDTDGQFEFSGIVTVTILPPQAFTLHQNYPNPFNAGTTISYELSKVATVRLKIFDALGRELLTLVEGEQVPGVYEWHWDGRDKLGRTVASGVYFYRLEAQNTVATKSLSVMK